LKIMHIYDNTKDYLVGTKFNPERLEQTVNDICLTSVSKSRYAVLFQPKHTNDKDVQVGPSLIDQANADHSDFVIMGLVGRKGIKKSSFAGTPMGKQLDFAMSHTNGSIVVIQDVQTATTLKSNTKTVFAVSVCLNTASTKGFIDALRLSKPGDEIHVVYVKSFLERTESDYTIALRTKFAKLFAAIHEEMKDVAHATYGDRVCTFHLLEKKKGYTTPQAIVEFADDVGAHFIVVGTNVLRSREKGKEHLGSISMQILMDSHKNFVIAHYHPSE